MYLTRHRTLHGPRWAVDGYYLARSFTLSLLLELPASATSGLLASVTTSEPAEGALLPPLEPMHEVWGAGVTYLRSRDARQAESKSGDVYRSVYDAVRPEIFFKAIGWRAVGHKAPIRIRRDSNWNVPEPELTLVINRHEEILGYCVGNDVSSRDIEGENPLYLPQAKIYDGSCAVGPGLLLTPPDQLGDLPIELDIVRENAPLFHGETRTSRMKRSLDSLVCYLGRELDFPHGVFLMTGTGIVPPDGLSLEIGDVVRITIGALTLENRVE